MKKRVTLITLLLLLTSFNACTSQGDATLPADPVESITETTTAPETTQSIENTGSTESLVSETTEELDIHDPEEKVSTWEEALTYLKEGNLRFTSNQTITRTTNEEDRDMLKDGQSPFAVVITCSDSRVSPEIYFDQKLGDIFVIRNAGNIADPTVLGSIEYAVEHLHAPLVVVVGHGSCGAVTGAYEGGEFPENLDTIISDIEASIEGSTDLDNAIQMNIVGVVKEVSEDEIIHELNVKVIGAFYDIVTGEVIFYE